MDHGGRAAPVKSPRARQACPTSGSRVLGEFAVAQQPGSCKEVLISGDKRSLAALRECSLGRPSVRV